MQISREEMPEGTADEGIRTLDLSFTKAVLYH